MTDHQYDDCQFEIYFDSIEGRTPTRGNPLRWDDLTGPRYPTKLPILVNGIQRSNDARRTKDYGVEAICCPSLDGRRANPAWPALNSLPDVVEAAHGTAVFF
jgi:isopentenyl diphosphate isomerase/L-lactate dehydrogenase-like FMN-dependent dehydrogenase